MAQLPRGRYPPPVYAPAVPADLASAPPASLLKNFLKTAGFGVPAGLLWWLLSPGGALYGAGTDAETWLFRDLVLALIEVVFGLLTGALMLRRAAASGAALAVLAVLSGCVAASAIAWQSGMWFASLATPPVAETVLESVEFSLRSYGVLPLWPATAALVVFAWTLGGLLRSRRG